MAERTPIPAAVAALVTERQGGRWCVDCRSRGLTPPPEEPLELDHLQPLARGGDNRHLNLRWSCRSHNRGRAARPLPARAPLPRWARRA